MQQTNSSSNNALTTVLTIAAAALIGTHISFGEKASATVVTEPVTVMHLSQPASTHEFVSTAAAIHSDVQLAPEMTTPAAVVGNQTVDTTVPAMATPYSETPDKAFTQSEFTYAAIAMEDGFWAQTYDGEWTADMENELLDAIEQRSINATTLDIVQCHNSICLVEFIHDTEEAHVMMLQHLAAIRPQLGSFVVKNEQSGPDIRTLVYFARPGQTLPLPFNLLTSV